MKQKPHRIAELIAWIAGIAAFTAGIGLAAQQLSAASSRQMPRLAATAALVHWGHGALDWLIPDLQGDPHVSDGKPPHRL